jgi:small subunit ribosomal protein S1
MSNAKAKTAKKIKNANRKLFGFERLLTIDPEFLAPGELETAKAQHEEFAALLNIKPASGKASLKDFVEGEVTVRTAKGSYVNIGQKFDAFVPNDEQGDLTVGDTATFWVIDEGKGDSVTISHVQARAWEKMKELQESGELIEAYVFALAIQRWSKKVSGVRVSFTHEELKGLRGFIPNSQIAAGVEIDQLEGTSLIAKVLDANPHKGGEFGSCVVSNKEAVKEQATRFISSLSAGDIITGTVSKFIKASPKDHDMSVLVNIGNGATGMIYRSEIAGYPRIKADKAMKIGDTIETIVTEVKPEMQRISLSTKALTRQQTLAQLEPGMVVMGEVLRSQTYGYFVHVGNGIEGLVHLSDLANDETGRREQLRHGDNIKVVIISITEGGKRVALGRRQLGKEAHS